MPTPSRFRWRGSCGSAKSSVLVVGNGGAARSAAYALVDSGAKVSIVGRNPDRVRSLARACGAEPLLREQLNGRKFDAVVHATPLGMFPHTEGCFFPDAIPAELVFDMVYNPHARPRCSAAPLRKG